MHDGNLFNSGHYFNDAFGVKTGIWSHFDDYEITQISYFPEGVCNIESHNMKDTTKILCQVKQIHINGLYHKKQPYII